MCNNNNNNNTINNNGLKLNDLNLLFKILMVTQNDFFEIYRFMA
jgi:hypothetical protein